MKTIFNLLLLHFQAIAGVKIENIIHFLQQNNL